MTLPTIEEAREEYIREVSMNKNKILARFVRGKTPMDATVCEYYYDEGGCLVERYHSMGGQTIRRVGWIPNVKSGYTKVRIND